MSNADLLATCRARLELARKATPGPWFWNHVGDDLNAEAEDGPPHYGSRGLLSAPKSYTGANLFADGSLCAHSGTHDATLFPALLAALERGAAMEAMLRESRQEHRTCEDTWYSCSASTGDEACSDDRRAGKPCDCGADEWNAKLDALLAEGSAARRPEQEEREMGAAP